MQQDLTHQSYARRLLLLPICCTAEAAAAAGGAPAQLNLLAKVSDTHCVGNSETVRTAVAGKPAVITLSAVTINKVQSAAAAVGLTYLQDLQFACLVKLGPAQTKAATDAAVKALLAPSPGVVAMGGCQLSCCPTASMYDCEVCVLDQKLAPAALDSQHHAAALKTNS